MSYAHTADIYVLPAEFVGHPEVTAMLGAFHSRSYRPMRERVAELLRGAVTPDSMRDKIRQYVVGYGHASILDMANVVVSIENVPILAAMAIEDHALFAGQETSTRYVDWSTEAFFSPLPSEAPAHLHDMFETRYAQMRATYVRVFDRVLSRLQAAHNLDPVHEGSSVANAAMRARAFDVARGFLPAGACTRVCWNTRLAAMKDHLRDLAIHPDPNIVVLARRIWAALAQEYPSAMGMDDAIGEGALPIASKMRWEPPFIRGRTVGDRPHLYATPLMIGAECLQALKTRRRCQPLPQRAFVDAPSVRLRGLLDLGSFRDLHRHRRGTHTWEYPSPTMAVEPWYYDMAEEPIPRDEDEDFVAQYYMYASRFGDFAGRGWTDLAYATRLSSRVPFSYTMDIPQLVYLLERRTSMDVHPTLRALLHDAFPQWTSTNIPLHVDLTPDPGKNGYILRRGSQTITIGGRDIAAAEAEQRSKTS